MREKERERERQRDRERESEREGHQEKMEAGSSTSLPGGNLVDGLPPASSL